MVIIHFFMIKDLNRSIVEAKKELLVQEETINKLSASVTKRNKEERHIWETTVSNFNLQISEKKELISHLNVNYFLFFFPG